MNIFECIPLYNEDQARATYLTISPPGFGVGYSYYFWEEDDQIIYYWGDKKWFSSIKNTTLV
jgi:hypothetical protein